jgi:hypothetical protein
MFLLILIIISKYLTNNIHLIDISMLFNQNQLNFSNPIPSFVEGFTLINSFIIKYSVFKHL